MPESPWHLVRKGNYEMAEKSVVRLMAEHEKIHSKSLVALMIHTNDLERSASQGTSYWNCFKGVDLRRTEIAVIRFLGQITCGAQFAYSATYFFQQAGLTSEESYKLNLGGTSIAFLGTITSWFLRCRLVVVFFTYRVCHAWRYGFLSLEFSQSILPIQMSSGSSQHFALFGS